MESSEQDITDEDRPAPVALVGYPRKGDPRGRRRLYKDRKSGTYVEIDVEDVVAPSSEIDDLEPGSIVVWVSGDAEVSLVKFPVSALYAKPPWPRH